MGSKFVQNGQIVRATGQIVTNSYTTQRYLKSCPASPTRIEHRVPPRWRLVVSVHSSREFQPRALI